MHIAIADAKAQFADLIRRAEAGEEIKLTRYGRPVARITAVAGRSNSLIGCMAGQFALPDEPDAGDAEAAALLCEGGLFPE